MNRNFIPLVVQLLQEEAEDEALLLALLERRKKRKAVKRLYANRSREGYGNILVTNHLEADETKYRQFFRLNKEQVAYVLNLVGNDIKTAPSAKVKQPISPQHKLLLTLSFIATGESFRSLSFAFRICYGYIRVIVKDVLKQLCNKLVPIFLPKPTVLNLEKIAQDFITKWNFPNCVGAMDGKHVRILCPKNSGSLYFNYKNYFSIVLLAVVDTNYKFIVIDVGSYGKESDSGIFHKSIMGQQIRSGDFNFPSDKVLPGSDVTIPHVIVGDEAFRLTKNCMKPYPKNQASEHVEKTIFNYHLCRARRVSENAFALLSQSFRIFYSAIAVLPETTDDIITATCCLHNMLRDEHDNSKQHNNCHMDISANNMLPLVRPGGYGDAEGFEVRNKLKTYFNSAEGAVEWKQDLIERDATA